MIYGGLLTSVCHQILPSTSNKRWTLLGSCESSEHSLIPIKPVAFCILSELAKQKGALTKLRDTSRKKETKAPWWHKMGLDIG